MRKEEKRDLESIVNTLFAYKIGLREGMDRIDLIRDLNVLIDRIIERFDLFSEECEPEKTPAASTLHPAVVEAERLAHLKVNSYLNKDKNLCIVEEAVYILEQQEKLKEGKVE